MKKWILALLLCVALHLQAVQLITPSGDLVPPAKKLLELCEIFVSDDIGLTLAEVQMQWMQADKERWEFDSKTVPDEAKARALFAAMGCINKVEPKVRYYDYALLLGALGPRMLKRLDFLYEQWKRGARFHTLVLLSGDRDLNAQLEDFPEGLTTEMELLRYQLDHHPLKKALKDVSIVEVDAPKVSPINRPTTATTIHEWLKLNPLPGTCLAVSNQPYVGYQEAVVGFLLPRSFSVEGIGMQVIEQPSMAILLDNFAKWFTYSILQKGVQ